MPRPCAVESHAHCYKRDTLVRRCHGLVPWSLTLTATKETRSSEDATALCRGVSRSLLEQMRHGVSSLLSKNTLITTTHLKCARDLSPWSYNLTNLTRSEFHLLL